MRTHAANPFAEHRAGDRFRVYFSTRDDRKPILHRGRFRMWYGSTADTAARLEDIRHHQVCRVG